MKQEELLLNLGPNIVRYENSERVLSNETIQDKTDTPSSVSAETIDYEQEFDSLLDYEEFSSNEHSINNILSFQNNIFNAERTEDCNPDEEAASSEDYEEWSSDEDSSIDGLYDQKADTGIIVHGLHNKRCFKEKEHPESEIAKWIDDLNRKVDFIHIYSPEDIVVKEEYMNDLTRVSDPYISMQQSFFENNVLEVTDTNSREILEKINGNCQVTMRNGDELHGNWRRGKREGLGGISGSRLEKMNIHMITGTYVSGVLTGLGRIIMKDESILEGWFHHGFLHGPVKGTVRGAVSFGGSVQPRGPICHLSWVGWYKAGLPLGTCWTSIPGDGWIVGKVDYDGKFSGNRIAFIYPDLTTALVGRFNDGALVSAVPGKVVSVSNINGIMVPEIKVISNDEYRYWRSTKEDILCPPHRKDIYEDKLVYVGMSTMPGSGEGLFAKTNIPEGTLFGYYNGIILGPDDSDPYIGKNSTGYSIMIDSQKPWLPKTRESDHMDILPKYQSSLDYSSTLAHKLNHSFSPNCEWADAQHPCYGRIPAARTISQVNKGDELFIHYMIDMEEAKEWYKEVWDNFSVTGDQKK